MRKVSGFFSYIQEVRGLSIINNLENIKGHHCVLGNSDIVLTRVQRLGIRKPKIKTCSTVY